MIVRHVIFLDDDGVPYLDFSGEPVDIGEVPPAPVAQDVETVWVPEVEDPDWSDDHFIPVPRGMRRKN